VSADKEGFRAVSSREGRLGKKPEMKILPMKTRDVNLTDEKRKLHSPAAPGEALHR